MPRVPNYDIDTMAKLLMDNELANRPELFRQLRDAMQSPTCKTLLAQVMSECLSKQKSPTELLGAGIIYGMILGINAEIYRAAKDDANGLVI